MEFHLKRDFIKCEMPSASFASSARALAKLGNFMANKGQINGKTLMSEQTFASIHSEPKKGNMNRGGAVNNFTKGGFCQFTNFHEKTEPTIQTEL